MDTGNAIETKGEATQPNEVVVTDLEATEATPQAEATEEQELYVDDSSDDQEASHKTEMSQAQAYAAFQKKKKQSAQRKEELNASAKREEELRKELDELKATVGNITRGEMPDPFDFDDKHAYYEALKKWEGAPKSKTVKEEAKKEAASNPVNDEAEFYLYQKEQELSKAIPEYEQAKAEVVESLGKYGIKDTGAALNYLSNISRLKGVDVAKAIFAINKSPRILDDIISAGSNDFAVADILANAESKVKTRSKKKIDSQPEPVITNSGAINTNSEQVNQARQKWIDSPTTVNYNAYQSAKNKKVNKNG